jgi:hypothetical protein
MTGEVTVGGGVLRLTWVSDHLAHVLEHSQADEPRPGSPRSSPSAG